MEFTLNGELVAEVGNLSPAILKTFDIKKEVFAARLNWTVATKFLPKHEVSYEPVSKFPSVRRDLALVIDKSVTFDKLKETAQKAERKLLTEVGIFDIHEGDRCHALAAYNAGENAVAEWDRRFGPLKSDEWVENIPYRETRRYVKKVLANYRHYQSLYGPALTGSSGRAIPVIRPSGS